MNVIKWDGKQITRPGIYSDIPLSDYHRADICDELSVSSTGLRRLWSESPKHYFDKAAHNPNRNTSDDEKEHFVLGRAVHHLICCQPNFKAEFVVRPLKAPDGRAWNGNNETCKQWIKNQKRAGKMILKPEWVEDIRGMAASICANPMVREKLEGFYEHSLFVKDTETGLWIKSRPDVIPIGSGQYADLKTTQSTLFRKLHKSLGDYGYHQQGALVYECAQALGLPWESFSLVWVEVNRPYCCRNQTLKDADIVRGMQQNRVALRLLRKCLDANYWPEPGEDNDGEYVDLPEHTRKSIDDRLKYELGETL